MRWQGMPIVIVVETPNRKAQKPWWVETAEKLATRLIIALSLLGISWNLAHLR